MQNYRSKFKILFWVYVVTFLFLFLYSFTQIDLGLVISRYPFFYQIEKAFQYIGYFNRPLSTEFCLIIFACLTILYFFLLRLATKKMIEKKFVWKIIIAGVILLAFSYNAFSYDIFNYMFDAKIITHYHANPYLHKALDYPGDPMLAFMHWTQRTYPYGPFWLVLTVPLSFIGGRIFLLTFFLFKLLGAAGYLGSVYFIGRIFQKIRPERETFGLIFFGLNPLVLIESLVSAHIDITMVFFSLFAMHFLLQKKYGISYILLFVSIGVKYVTAALLPVFLWVHVLQKKEKKIIPEKLFLLAIIFLLIAIFVETMYGGNFQAWYLLAPLSIAVFLSHRYYVFIPSVIISVLSLLLYVPFLYLGNWNPPVPQILSGIMYASYGLSIIATGFVFIERKRK
jgi:Glycosyltransferase family 87